MELHLFLISILCEYFPFNVDLEIQYQKLNLWTEQILRGFKLNNEFDESF